MAETAFRTPEQIKADVRVGEAKERSILDAYFEVHPTKVPTIIEHTREGHPLDWIVITYNGVDYFVDYYEVRERTDYTYARLREFGSIMVNISKYQKAKEIWEKTKIPTWFLVYTSDGALLISRLWEEPLARDEKPQIHNTRHAETKDICVYIDFNKFTLVIPPISRN